MDKKSVVIIFVCALMFGLVRDLFLKNFLAEQVLLKEIIRSSIEIIMVVALVKIFNRKVLL